MTDTKAPEKKEKPQLTSAQKASRLLQSTMGHSALIAQSLVNRMNDEEVAKMGELFDTKANGLSVDAVYGQHLDRLREEAKEKQKQSPISVSELTDQKAVVDNLPSASTGGEAPNALI